MLAQASGRRQRARVAQMRQQRASDWRGHGETHCVQEELVHLIGTAAEVVGQGALETLLL